MSDDGGHKHTLKYFLFAKNFFMKVGPRGIKYGLNLLYFFKHLYLLALLFIVQAVSHLFFFLQAVHFYIHLLINIQILINSYTKIFCFLTENS